MEPMMMTQPMSRLILVKMGEIMLGSSSRKRMWRVPAPLVCAEATKNSLRRALVSPYTRRAYQGHHISETAIIELNRFGSSTDAIARASTDRKSTRLNSSHHYISY